VEPRAGGSEGLTRVEEPERTVDNYSSRGRRATALLALRARCRELHLTEPNVFLLSSPSEQCISRPSTVTRYARVTADRRPERHDGKGFGRPYTLTYTTTTRRKVCGRCAMTYRLFGFSPGGRNRATVSGPALCFPRRFSRSEIVDVSDDCRVLSKTCTTVFVPEGLMKTSIFQSNYSVFNRSLGRRVRAPTYTNRLRTLTTLRFFSIISLSSSKTQRSNNMRFDTRRRGMKHKKYTQQNCAGNPFSLRYTAN